VVTPSTTSLRATAKRRVIRVQQARKVTRMMELILTLRVMKLLTIEEPYSKRETALMIS
jgi:hypothetical protein